MSMFGKVRSDLNRTVTLQDEKREANTNKYKDGGIHVLDVSGSTVVDTKDIGMWKTATFFFNNVLGEETETANLRFVHGGGARFSGFIHDFINSTLVPVSGKDFMAMHDFGGNSFSQSYKISLTNLGDRIYCEAWGDWF